MSDYQPENFVIYLYTDRTILPSRQTVYFKGILRDRDDVQFSLPAATEVPVKIYDDRGEIVYDEVLRSTRRGRSAASSRSTTKRRSVLPHRRRRWRATPARNSA